MTLFDEHELKQLFEDAEEKVAEIKKEFVGTTPKQKHCFWRHLWQIFLFAIIFFIVSYLVINFPALYLNARYWWLTEYRTPKQSAPLNNTEKISTTVPAPNIQNNLLTISKINLQAPIIWDVKDDQMTEKLRAGVIHYAGTEKPDSAIGPMVVTGHSSNSWWEKGDYNTIFALLNKLVVGDEIQINYQNKVYNYRVSKKEIVNPDNNQVFDKTDQLVLVLVTCTPLGTNLRRLLVYANPI